jgi:hypothetical protein
VNADMALRRRPLRLRKMTVSRRVGNSSRHAKMRQLYCQLPTLCFFARTRRKQPSPKRKSLRQAAVLRGSPKAISSSGEIGIRTRDAGFPTYRISNPALSATQPSLRSAGTVIPDRLRLALISSASLAIRAVRGLRSVNRFFGLFCSESTVGTGDYNPKGRESQGRSNVPVHSKKADNMRRSPRSNRGACSKSSRTRQPNPARDDESAWSADLR